MTHLPNIAASTVTQPSASAAERTAVRIDQQLTPNAVTMAGLLHPLVVTTSPSILSGWSARYLLRDRQ
jgi:hypothetical protein